MIPLTSSPLSACLVLLGLWGLIGLAGPETPASRGFSSGASASQPEGVFKRKLEWSGGGLCQGMSQGLIGVCQRGNRNPASARANRT